jgi:hypothetical protein
MKEIDIHHKLNLLVDRQLCLTKISIVIVSIRQHPVHSSFLFGSFWKIAQILIR